MARIFAWLLNGVYLLAILLALPWILWAALKHGKYREGFAAKLLGKVPRRTGDRPCLWLHAVSVGEVNLLATTIAELLRRQPNVQIFVSTTTKTGFDLARKKYADHTVFYCPVDFSWAVQRAMQRIRPNALVLAELELWPNLIRAARQQGAAVAIINGRLSDTSFRGYRRIRPLVGYVLRQIDRIVVQNEPTAARFRQLGAKHSTIHISGSLKFDGAQTDRANLQTQQFRHLAGFTDQDIVLLAGSTQSPEEAYALEIYKKLSKWHPKLRLVLVPRHPQRFDEVATLFEKSGLPYSRRSELDRSKIRDPKSKILLVDTVGELGAWWGTATLGLVGGSFGNRGGQNMLEPAAYGVATCFGPKTKNFRDIVAQLLAVDGARVVENREALEQFIRQMLENPSWAQQLGQRGRKLVLSQQGATHRTVDLLLPLVDSNAPNLSHRAA